MKNFYFLRHGQTDANKAGLMCGGKWDLSLNERGQNQAKSAAQILKKFPIKNLVVSPLKRARETASYIRQEIPSEEHVYDSFAEWDIGSWDRRPFESVKEEFLGSGAPSGGETREAFGARVAEAFKCSQRLEAPVLIVAHGAVWLAIQDYLELERFRLENGVPLEVTTDGSAWKVTPLE